MRRGGWRLAVGATTATRRTYSTGQWCASPCLQHRTVVDHFKYSTLVVRPRGGRRDHWTLIWPSCAARTPPGAMSRPRHRRGLSVPVEEAQWPCGATSTSMQYSWGTAWEDLRVLSATSRQYSMCGGRVGSGRRHAACGRNGAREHRRCEAREHRLWRGCVGVLRLCFCVCLGAAGTAGAVWVLDTRCCFSGRGCPARSLRGWVCAQLRSLRGGSWEGHG